MAAIGTLKCFERLYQSNWPAKQIISFMIASSTEITNGEVSCNEINALSPFTMTNEELSETMGSLTPRVGAHSERNEQRLKMRNFYLAFPFDNQQQWQINKYVSLYVCVCNHPMENCTCSLYLFTPNFDANSFRPFT